MPRIVDCLATPMAAGMFRDDATILANDNAIGIGMDVDRPPDGAGVHRVLVVVEAHQAGLRHRRRQRVEAVEPATIRDEIWPLLLEDVPYRLVRPFRMGMHLGVGDTFVGQPGVQLIVGFDPKPRREETFPDQTDLVLDLTLLPTRGRRAGHRINQVMAAHLQEAAIILTVLADEDRLHRRLHVVVDATGAGTSKEGEGAFVRVEYHLLRLTRISPAEHHPAVAQADMRNLHGHRDAAHHNDLVAPIELVGFARRERQWNEGGRGLARVLPAPGPCVTAHGVVATLVAQRPQFFEQPDQGQTLSRRGLGIRRQHPIEIGLPPSQPGPRLDLPLVRKRCLPRAQDLADRIARDLQVTGDLLDRLALDQMLAPYPADRLHNQHPPPPARNKAGSPAVQDSGGQFWTPIPRLRGQICTPKHTQAANRSRTTATSAKAIPAHKSFADETVIAEPSPEKGLAQPTVMASRSHRAMSTYAGLSSYIGHWLDTVLDLLSAYDIIGVPKGIRTPVTAVKGRCPRPLDDGDAASSRRI